MSEWISVKDKLPTTEGTTPCVVAIRNYKGELESAFRWFQEKEVRGKMVKRWLYPWEAISNEEIVYWMPLPEPPIE